MVKNFGVVVVEGRFLISLILVNIFKNVMFTLVVKISILTLFYLVPPPRSEFLEYFSTVPSFFVGKQIVLKRLHRAKLPCIRTKTLQPHNTPLPQRGKIQGFIIFLCLLRMGKKKGLLYFCRPMHRFAQTFGYRMWVNESVIQTICLAWSVILFR